MTTIESIFSKNAPEPLGHYSQAVRADGLIHVSGQLPIKAGDQNIASSLPFEQQAHLVLRNLLSILGSRLIEFHSQNKTVAASMMAEKKVSGQRSYRVATRRQSFRRPNMISMRLRRL